MGPGKYHNGQAYNDKNLYHIRIIYEAKLLEHKTAIKWCQYIKLDCHVIIIDPKLDYEQFS